MKNKITLISLMIIGAVGFAQENSEDENLFSNTIFVGNYTKKEGHVNGKASGIYTLYQNPESGDLKVGNTVAKVINPSFVKVSNDKNFLFAVSELGSDFAPSGFVYSYKINPDKSLTQLSRLSTEGFAPCHIETDQTGKYVFVSNYVGGVVMLYKKMESGNLRKIQRINLENSDISNAHSVKISSNNKFAYISDLGNDKIWIYNFNAETGKLSINENAYINLENGAGPRHFSFSIDERFAYSLNEINSSVSVFKVLKEGELELIQNITSLPISYTGHNAAADIHVHPSGDFLYASNRGHNSIASYKIDQKTGKLNNIGYTTTKGKTPRNFAISPDGNFLYAANQDSNNITTFKIDKDTGALITLKYQTEAMTPVCLEFEP